MGGGREDESGEDWDEEFWDVEDVVFYGRGR